MLQILKSITQDNLFNLVDYLDAWIKPELQPDVSNYAPGRMRAWLQYEAPLSNSRPWASGVQDERLWSFLTKICAPYDFVPDLGLISIGGGISRHRDASYAGFRAFGLNLGRADFCWEDCYPGYKWVANTPQSADEQRAVLQGSELFEFNCKNPHWVENCDPDRWGINLWQITNKEIGRFIKFKGSA